VNVHRSRGKRPQDFTLKRAEWACLFEQCGVFAGFFQTKDRANFLQEIWQFLLELSGSLGHLGEGQQFLADQIIQGVSKAEVFLDATRGRALFDPFPLKLNL
jgi:hypothetical protein